MRVWDVATGIPWAITEDALRTILEVASRASPLDAEVIDRFERMQAVQAIAGEALEGTARVTVRDGIAIVPVVGPIFRYANLFTRVSGATSTELLARDFQIALESPAVRAILFAVDSPGGEANGISELSDLIFEARGRKPMVAHVSGTGASGAYWIASSADEVVTADTGIVGSIGVILRILDTRQADAKAGFEEIEFVSSQTPKKSPDPKEQKGRAQIQRMVDDLAAVFIAAVARNRGVDEDGAAEKFGEGDVFVGQAAVERGLADRVATFEQTFAALRDQIERRSFPAAGGFTSTQEGKMPVETTTAPAAETKPAGQDTTASAPQAPTITAAYIRERHPDVAAELREEGAKAERERIAKIEALALPGHEQLAARAKAEGMSPEAFATAQIEAEKGKRQARLGALKQDEADLDAPAAGAHNDTDPHSDEAIAARILSAGKVVRPARKEA